MFSDRIEILSRGTIPLGQTMEGFFAGESVPVNQKLSEILKWSVKRKSIDFFKKLHILWIES